LASLQDSHVLGWTEGGRKGGREEGRNRNKVRGHGET
jgi:hypothetical protein